MSIIQPSPNGVAFDLKALAQSCGVSPTKLNQQLRTLGFQQILSEARRQAYARGFEHGGSRALAEPMTNDDLIQAAKGLLR